MVEVTLGQVMMTKGISGALKHDCAFRPFINNCLQRHKLGDWGDLSEEDKAQNNEALLDSAQLLSAYQYTDDIRIWIVTEADRTVTTVLLPEEN